MKKQELHIHQRSKYETNNSSLIGKYCYPIDNSYAFEVRTGMKYALAGHYGEKPFKVLIVSEPYKLKIDDSLLLYGRVIEHEFITVMYRRKCHVIINHVRPVKEKALK